MIAPTLAVVGDYVNSMFKISALVSAIGGLGTEEQAAILGGTAVRLLDLERPRAV